MAATKLYIDEKKKTKKGFVSIYCLVHIENKSIKINTKVSIPLERWDKEKLKVRGTDKDSKDNNLIIGRCLSAINQIFVRYRLQGKILTADLLLREYHNPTYYIDFYKWLDKKVDERIIGREIGIESGKHHKVLLNKLKEFKADLTFAEIDIKFIKNFRNWCRTNKGNSVNTIQKTFGYFKAYLNIAVREDVINVNTLDLINFKRTSVQIVYCTENELNTLIKFYDNGEFQDNYHKTLRHFLFMCLTGVRISDLKRLKKESIQENVLKFVAYKTREKKGNEINIPLLEKANQLIKQENSQTEFLFDLYAEQKMNEYLKKIAELAGINKKLRNHAGRHTFATLFLEKTSDLASLQKLLGHSNISETMKYVHISTKKLNEQMVNFGQLLNM